MIPFEDALGAALAKMGLAEPSLMLELVGEWSELAGPAWVGRATPLFVRDRVLVVEATDRGSVAVLRYGVVDLASRLTTRFGADVITGVEVRPPTVAPRAPR